MVCTLDVNNFEEDSYVYETSETVVRYIVDLLITSVTASVGMGRNVFIFIFRFTYFYLPHSYSI